MKRALITGCTGQDGSYLTELLLAKGYHVDGIIRRSSSFNTARIDHVYGHERLKLHYGDLTDTASIAKVMQANPPDEIYNLGAMSHVKVSFDIPEYTGAVTGLGAVRLFEAAKEHCPNARIYQASSSEQFGSTPPPQNEQTPFHPRSPYSAAKCYAHASAVNYRERGMHVSCGILNNHECVATNTPVLIRRGDTLSVETPKMLAAWNSRSPIQTHEVNNIEIWDGSSWTSLKAVTQIRIKESIRHRHEVASDFKLLSVEARAGIIEATAHHRMLRSDDTELRSDQCVSGSRLKLGSFPPLNDWVVISDLMGEFLGLMASDGHVADDGRHMRFTNNDESLHTRIAYLWKILFMGTSSRSVGKSGFNPELPVGVTSLSGVPQLIRWLREQLYTEERWQRVPPLVLNAKESVRHAFLNGYYAGDGLKAGCNDSVKSDSAILSQGLCWLYASIGRDCSVYVEQRKDRRYYQLNILNASNKNHHLRKDPNEVRRLVPSVVPCDQVYDLETSSGLFMAGVGRLVVHNSPRRAETFVTRKITAATARIKAGLQQKLRLGNLDSKRDWGFAGDYVEAMWLMLQQERPDDFVIATGEMHSVREFAEAAFAHVGLDWREYVEVDPRYFRPSEVDALCGDASKARRVLGWEPKTKFTDLVRMMVDADVAALR